MRTIVFITLIIFSFNSIIKATDSANVFINYQMVTDSVNVNCKLWPTITNVSGSYSYKWLIYIKNIENSDTLVKTDSVIYVNIGNKITKIILQISDFPKSNLIVWNGIELTKTKFFNICYTTVNNIENKNFIYLNEVEILNKINTEPTANINILELYKLEYVPTIKSSTVNNNPSNFKIIDSILFKTKNNSFFIDNSSKPNERSEKYYLLNTQTNTKTNIHQTMHLILTKNAPDQYKLAWNAYEGFNYNWFYIYKGSDSVNLQLIDSVPNTQLNYLHSDTGIAYFMVAVRKYSICQTLNLKSASEPYSQSVSNIEDNTKLKFNSDKINNSLNTLNCIIYPNPFTNGLNVSVISNKSKNATIQIYNTLGVVVFEKTLILSIGENKIKIDKNELLQASKVNFIKINAGSYNYISKIIKQ